MSTPNDALKAAIAQSISYPEYVRLMEELSESGGTTGPVKSESLARYTHLNAARMRRLHKTAKLSVERNERLQSLGKPQTWLIITESWCGDAAQILPFVQLLAQENPRISVKLVFRDDHPELMDQFLTKGTRAIPVVIFLNELDEVLGHWAPRPVDAQDMVIARKADPNPEPYDTFQVKLQKWYLKDKGRSTVEEVLNRWEAVTPAS